MEIFEKMNCQCGNTTEYAYQSLRLCEICYNKLFTKCLLCNNMEFHPHKKISEGIVVIKKILEFTNKTKPIFDAFNKYTLIIYEQCMTEKYIAIENYIYTKKLKFNIRNKKPKFLKNEYIGIINMYINANSEFNNYIILTINNELYVKCGCIIYLVKRLTMQNYKYSIFKKRKVHLLGYLLLRKLNHNIVKTIIDKCIFEISCKRKIFF